MISLKIHSYYAVNEFNSCVFLEWNAMGNRYFKQIACCIQIKYASSMVLVREKHPILYTKRIGYLGILHGYFLGELCFTWILFS